MCHFKNLFGVLYSKTTKTYWQNVECQSISLWQGISWSAPKMTIKLYIYIYIYIFYKYKVYLASLFWALVWLYILIWNIDSSIHLKITRYTDVIISVQLLAFLNFLFRIFFCLYTALSKVNLDGSLTSHLHVPAYQPGTKYNSIWSKPNSCTICHTWICFF